MSNKPATKTSEETVAPATAPVSMPPAAGSSPATAVDSPVAPRSVIAPARPSGIMFSTNPDEVLPGIPEARRTLLMAEVACQVIADRMNGVVRHPTLGSFQRYSFRRGDIVRLPRWFALQHPDKLVIKEM